MKPLETEIGKKAPLFRLNWHVVTWGVTGAISSDWLPSLGTATYFDETFPMSHDRRTTVGDADLVVLLLGGEDFRDTLMMADEPIDVLSQRTVDNIAAIAVESEPIPERERKRERERERERESELIACS